MHDPVSQFTTLTDFEPFFRGYRKAIIKKFSSKKDKPAPAPAVVAEPAEPAPPAVAATSATA